MEREFAIIGLGGFGASLGRRLEAMGHIVLGVDRHIDAVQAISDDITSAVVLEPTNEDALQEVDISSFSTVVVALENDFEATALVTTYLKGLGIARVICLTGTARHRDILLRIGADQVIVSDEDSGIRLAETLALPNMLERVLLDTENSLIELKAPGSWVTKPLSRLDEYNLAVVLIQRQDALIPCPSPDTLIESNDTLFVVGQRENILAVAASA
jgi:trk system potassium uptake protein TrkA